MRKLYCLLIVGIFSISLSQAQYLKSDNQHYELGLSSNGPQFAFALGTNHLHGLGKKKRFRVGYGLRFTLNTGRNAAFWTAPAELTSGTTGLGVLFSENIFSNFDTLNMNSYLVGSLNASIHLNYAFSEKWEAEFNIDAVGFSFGSTVQADYETSKSAPFGSPQEAKPTALNLLLTSDNDIGSLNSELFVRYYPTSHWGIKLGATFVFAEYTTTNELYLENDRFRNKALMGMVGITYTPFKTLSDDKE